MFSAFVLLIQSSVVLSQSSLLLKRCDPKVVNSCPVPSTICNKKLGLCECAPNYPIPRDIVYPLYTSRQCLDYRSLGEECLISKQCKAVPNALCLTPDGEELKEYISILKKMTKTKGQCRCRPGYRRISRNECDINLIFQFACSSSHQCLALVMSNTDCPRRKDAPTECSLHSLTAFQKLLQTTVK